MFDTITWQEFLLAVALIYGGYYVLTIIFFFKSSISKPGNRSVNQSPVKNKIPAKEKNEAHDLMGTTEPNAVPESDHITTTGSDELIFSAPQEKEHKSDPEPNRVSEESLIIGTIADLLQEARTLIQVISECDGDREESISMFRSLFSKYPQLAGTHFRAAINMFILDMCKEECAFDLSITEINSWWPDHANQSVASKS